MVTLKVNKGTEYRHDNGRKKAGNRIGGEGALII